VVDGSGLLSCSIKYLIPWVQIPSSPFFSISNFMFFYCLRIIAYF
jgi:hypothetical protein